LDSSAYEALGPDLWLFSTSGGTDLCTAFVGGVPTLPVYEGELQARALGAKVESFDEDGEAHIGQVGELVLTEPMPSMPIAFWGDDDGSRLRESYFSMYPGVWRHGDWIEITERGTAIISGRSDSTINRGGIRMGTSEIYSAVLADDDVVDALVVDIDRSPTHPDGWMPLFVVLREGASLDDDLVGRIKKRIREDCSPRHVPNEIHQIEEVPRTLSGKPLEVPVKRILMGHPAEKAASRESLANPGALDYFVELASPPSVDEFRPNAWPTTPDILPAHLQHAPLEAFATRVVLAATLAPSYGVFGPSFELGETEPFVLPDGRAREELARSEKYEVRRWSLGGRPSLRPLLTELNRIRRGQLALHTLRTLRFHGVDDDALICYSKTSHAGPSVDPDEPGGASMLMVVNLDPHHTRSGTVELDLGGLGVDGERPYDVHDLLGDDTYTWSGPRAWVELDPRRRPAHLFRVTQAPRETAP